MENSEDQAKRPRKQFFKPQKASIFGPDVEPPDVDPRLSEALSEPEASSEVKKGGCGCFGSY